MAQILATSWETVFRSVERAVEWGRSHADYSGSPHRSTPATSNISTLAFAISSTGQVVTPPTVELVGDTDGNIGERTFSYRGESVHDRPSGLAEI